LVQVRQRPSVSGGRHLGTDGADLLDNLDRAPSGADAQGHRGLPGSLPGLAVDYLCSFLAGTGLTLWITNDCEALYARCVPDVRPGRRCCTNNPAAQMHM